MKITSNTLKSIVKGKVVLPEDANYSAARKVYNGMINKFPAIILQCADVGDVIEGIKFGRANRMEVAVKSGGHNGAGLALVDKGLVIDLSAMRHIEVDVAKKAAKVQAGCTLGDIDKATYEYGLALPVGINSTTGISGLTLGGGIGYLSRKGGLTIDNLLEAEVVLANGDRVITNNSLHPDLFWAIRGGGGNFGIVVSFTFGLLDVKNVYAGPMLWPMEKASAVMRFYDDYTKNAPEDLYGFFTYMIIPPGEPFPRHLHNKNMCGIVWCYTGSETERERIFKPVREAISPALDLVDELPMPVLNGLFDALYPPGLQWYWKAHYISELSDDCIRESIKYGASIPTLQSTTHFYPVDGKVHDIGMEQTAWANRKARWVQVIVGVDPYPANSDKVISWCKDFYNAMAIFSTGGSYVNFMMEEGHERVKASYGINYDRLQKVKKIYDPENFFHINQNIQP